MAELYRRLQEAILEIDPVAKFDAAALLRRDWERGKLELDTDSPILPIDDPGRPAQPRLVDPRELPRRSFATPQGRIRLLHAFAHIEFNAVNIALDAVYRFRALGRRYIGDWLRVGDEEAVHFRLLDTELRRRGSYYGDCAGHGGLWDMVCRTRDDPLHRMALVPRVMEARGLDVSPGMIARFRQFGDMRAAQILATIYRDEIGHVGIGNYWYGLLCAARGLDPQATFRRLIEDYMGGSLRGPFNVEARLEAGFEAAELEALQESGRASGAYTRGS
jgi:uncharacterized ferritin-like protein (DUF455 family)